MDLSQVIIHGLASSLGIMVPDDVEEAFMRSGVIRQG
jgi:hypothetical protein